MSKMSGGLDPMQQNILAFAIIGTVLLCSLIVVYYALRQIRVNMSMWKEQKVISKMVAAGTLRKGSKPGSIKLANGKATVTKVTAMELQGQLKADPTL